MEIPYLSTDDISKMLNGDLHYRRRKMTASQMKMVVSACRKCSIPLFVNIALDEALTWKSYTPPEKTDLKTSVDAAISALLNRIEKYHGTLLVSHALSYITLAKQGLR